jgi:hypothetical protein
MWDLIAEAGWAFVWLSAEQDLNVGSRELMVCSARWTDWNRKRTLRTEELLGVIRVSGESSRGLDSVDRRCHAEAPNIWVAEILRHLRGD